MKYFRFEPFMAAYRVSFVAALAFFVLLVALPLWALIPAAVWILATALMLMEFRRACAMDRLWQPTPPRQQS